MVRAFWNFKLKVLKYSRNCSLDATLILNFPKCTYIEISYSFSDLLLGTREWRLVCCPLFWFECDATNCCDRNLCCPFSLLCDLYPQKLVKNATKNATSGKLSMLCDIHPKHMLKSKKNSWNCKREKELTFEQLIFHTTKEIIAWRSFNLYIHSDSFKTWKDLFDI